MTTTFWQQVLPSKPTVIDGQVTEQPVSPFAYVLAAQTKLVRVAVKAGASLTLRAVKIITRPSGRRVHLSRYLVGICTRTGLRVEVFLERVSGLAEHCFTARLNLSRWLAGQLSPLQALHLWSAR